MQKKKKNSWKSVVPEFWDLSLYPYPSSGSLFRGPGATTEENK